MGPRPELLRWTALGVLAVVAVGTLGACTSSGGSASSAAGAAGSAPLATVPSPAHRAEDGAAGGGAARSDTAGKASDGTLTDFELGSAKIRVANMTVQVKRGQSVSAKADAAETIATAVGGEVDSDDRTAGKYPTANLLLRIPPEDLTAVLRQLSGLGTEKSREVSTRDVTSRVADVTSRVASARAAIERLRVLYQHAQKIGDVITIEDELNQRESDLESLQAQARALSAETATAAVTLSLTSPPPAAKTEPKPVDHSRSGFVGGLVNGWHAFTKGVSVLATIVGAVLPFAVLLIVLAVAVRLFWPRLRPARRPTQDPTSS